MSGKIVQWRLPLLFVILIACWLVGACSSEYPADNLRGQISGRLFYTGSALSKVEHPAVGVYAMIDLSLSGLPNASYLELNPTFPAEGFSYVLENLDPYTYLIVSQIIDLDKSGDPMKTGVAMGLVLEVTVAAGQETSDINITLSDGAIP